MPVGAGSYGSKVGRPPAKNGNGKKKTGKGSMSMKEKMAKLRARKK